MNLIHHLQSLAAIVLTFGMVIFLHESGHFILCRVLGVRVEKFAFGFGPELIGFTGASGTRFSIHALPLGGFVKPVGEEPETCSGAPDEYFGQVWYRRLAIVAAGPAMNYLLAFTLFTGVVYLKGMPEPNEAPVIGNMMKEFPAERAGLDIDDEIIAINGNPVKTWDELAGTIHKFPNKEVELTYRRKEVTATVKMLTRKDDASGNGVIGIMPKATYKSVGFLTAMKEGAHQCYALTEMTITTISSKIYKRERPDLAGPVGIMQMVSRAAHSGWEDLVFLIGLISVAIGFFNILPIPLLDGGHAATYIWEGIAGKRPGKEIMAGFNTVGIAFLFSLLIFATYNDVLRIHNEHKNAKPPVAEPAPTK